MLLIPVLKKFSKYLIANIGLLALIFVAASFPKTALAVGCDCSCVDDSGDVVPLNQCASSSTACDSLCGDAGFASKIGICTDDPTCDNTASLGFCMCSQTGSGACTTRQACQDILNNGTLCGGSGPGKWVKVLNDDASCSKVKASFGQCQCGTSVSCKTLQQCLNGAATCAGNIDFVVDAQCNQTISDPTFTTPPSTTSPSSPSGATIIEQANPLRGTDLRTALGRIINIFTGLSGTVALIMFIYGGVLFLFSQGDDAKVARAQGVFKWSTLGLVVIFTSYAILNQVFGALEAQFGANTSGIGYPDIYPLGQISPAVLVGRIIQYALGIVGVVALVIFIWGGFQYFLAVGDAKRAESGRKTIIYAVIGLIIIFTAYAAATFVVNTLSSPVSNGDRPESGDIPTPSNPDAGENGGLPGGATFTACGQCTCVLGAPNSTPAQETRITLSGTFQTEAECDTRCKVQHTNTFKRSECTQTGTVAPGVTNPASGLNASCGQCFCKVHIPSSGPGSVGSIELRPAGQSATIGQCITTCQNIHGSNLIGQGSQAISCQ